MARRCRSTMQNLQRGNHGYLRARRCWRPGRPPPPPPRSCARSRTQLTEQGVYPAADEVHGVRRRPRRGDSRRRAPGDVAADGRGRLPAAHRLRQRRQPAAGARRRAAARDGGAHGDRRGAAIGWCGSCSPRACVLAVVGAVLGLALAAAALRVLIALDPTSLPPLAPVRLDATVVLLHAGARRGHDAALRSGAGAADAARQSGRVAARGQPAGHARRRPPAPARRAGGRRSGAGGRARRSAPA